ncbi:MAG: DNA mismatch repair protein MutS [Acidimicrobiales bacterium]|nr:DNA mismatch repair protein MutS [Hyphomonadaceae bacterium]RZV45009.1 MAG: DNA mismatch repair protein MutS [Acidimicrobiales bacterium]
MNKPVQPAAKAKALKPTPMMAQYLAIKQDAGDEVILFYRMGDFYEMFFDDAVRAAAALDIALTKRGKHADQDIPMCGVPVHASETYLQRLIKAGFRVAVCEQTEDPAEAKKRGYKAVVKREIVRVVTPGTLTEDTLLDARTSNFILSIALTHGGNMAVAWADISVGSFDVCAINPQRLEAELSALSPREIVISESLYQDPHYHETLSATRAAMTPLAASKFDARSGERRLQAVYEIADLEAFGNFSNPELSAAGALLEYLELTQAGQKTELSPPRQRQTSGYMAIDPATRASLEIDRTQTGQKKGSLLSVVDKTVTGPGARQLAARLNRPILNSLAINQRLDSVSFFVGDKQIRNEIRETLKRTGDAARAASRIALGRGGPRDLLTIAGTLTEGQHLSDVLKKLSDELPGDIDDIRNALNLKSNTALAALIEDIGNAINPACPIQARDGGFVKNGWQQELDKLLSLRDESRRIIAGLQAQYSKKTGVQSLKIKHNNVLGYFIEVTPRHGDALMSDAHKEMFIHRQTLVSGIRFTTTELVDLDAQISGAAEKALGIELEIFEQFSARIRENAEDIRIAAVALAELDVLAGLAEWAVRAKAVRPIVDDSSEFKIEGGRHPVVEAALARDGAPAFTANDCHLDADGKEANRLTLITGPNMAGKSTYLRQNALMLVLAQSGCYVPAQNAHIGIADALFSRVGASDDLSRGRSTFMSEMIETAAILHQAGPRAFVILDEIGRGTATFDGLSIAWATAEHLYEVNKCRALFATHYHELTALIEKLSAAGNACLRAKEWDGDLVFLHDVKPGAADKSYGVQVAKLAGLPAAAVERAREVLTRLETEADEGADGLGASLGGLPLFAAPKPATKAKPSAIDTAIAKLDVDSLSPRDALDLLYELKSSQETL